MVVPAGQPDFGGGEASEDAGCGPYAHREYELSGELNSGGDDFAPGIGTKSSGTRFNPDCPGQRVESAFPECERAIPGRWKRDSLDRGSGNGRGECVSEVDVCTSHAGVRRECEQHGAGA